MGRHTPQDRKEAEELRDEIHDLWEQARQIVVELGADAAAGTEEFQDLKKEITDKRQKMDRFYEAEHHAQMQESIKQESQSLKTDSIRS